VDSSCISPSARSKVFEGKAGKNISINYSRSETWTTPLIEVGQKEKDKNQLNQKKKSNKNRKKL